MKVKVKKNYSGPLGRLKAGEVLDLHPVVVGLLGDVVEPAEAAQPTKQSGSPADKQAHPRKTKAVNR